MNNFINVIILFVCRNIGRCRGISRTRPPHGIRVTKGAVHVAVTRGYVDYVLHDHRARDILKWMSYSCYIPDEAFFTTLNHNPHLHVPGSYKGRNIRKYYFIEVLKDDTYVCVLYIFSYTISLLLTLRWKIPIKK
jgi:hypothetical protein